MINTAIRVVFVFGVFAVAIMLGSISNLIEYKNLYQDVNQVKTELETVQNEIQAVSVGDSNVMNVDKFTINDVITSSGSTVSGVKLLTLDSPTKVIAKASKVEDIPNGGYYEFEVTYSDLDLLLKKIDDSALLCDISIVPVSNKMFIKVLTGGAFM